MRLNRLIAMLIAIMLLTTGCGTIAPSSDSADNTTTNQDNNRDNTSGMDLNTNNDEDPIMKFRAEVMEVGESLLVTPDSDSNESKSSNKISVATPDANITDMDGKEITTDVLKPGDILEITYNGIILESYPAQITASAIELVDHNLVIDGYLAIIDDIYQEDEGLNDDIELLTLDTTDWVELSDMEKEIIFSQLKTAYSLEIMEGTFDELVEQGIIDKENLYFENGVHIKISKLTYDSKDKEFTYSIEKWRSGLGAIGADDVSAKYKDGEWTIKKGSMWVS